jgi:hypothetical protein
MSSVLVCAQPATSFSRLLVPQEKPALVLNYLSTIPRLSRVTPAGHLDVRPAPTTVSSGLPELDALTGGLPRGCLTEIFGPASSGRTSVLAAALAAVTRRQEACALVDVSDAFDPQSATAAGVELKNLLWVRCDPESSKDDKKRNGARFSKKNLKTEMACLEQALKVTDLILQSGGFGMVAIDMGDVPFPAARRIPLTSWFRFRRAVENTPTILLVLGQGPCAGTCTSLLLRLAGQSLVVCSRSGELSALSSQLSENELHDGQRTIAIHNFPNSQNSWALHRGVALPGGKQDCPGTAPEGRRDNSPALQRWDEWTKRASPGETTDILTHTLKPCSTQNTPSSPIIPAQGCEESAAKADLPAHAELLDGISITAELLRSRLERVPAQSVRTRFETRTNNRQS